jgi:cell shape-determining protein MreD
MLLLLLFDTTFTPRVLDWYSLFHVFASVGVTFQIQLLQAKLEGEVFSPKCLFIDDYFQNIIHVIFWVILIEGFLFCVQELFGHCTFDLTHCISFAHLHYVFF